jgi:predicted ABC-type ATPase
VLSTPKYRTLVRLAKSFGFEVRLLYVCLNSPELNVERVRLRVAKGGHAVPEKKIVERYERSFKQLPWFLRHADFAVIFDNSGATPTVVGRKSAELIEVDPSAPDIVKNTVGKIRR